jgi:2-methylisocitrate lyase-like PEP mutase family enzyme
MKLKEFAIGDLNESALVVSFFNAGLPNIGNIERKKYIAQLRAIINSSEVLGVDHDSVLGSTITTRKKWGE